MGQIIKTDIAIMGSGLAGMGAAYRLAKETDLNITVFEKRPFQGGAVSNCPMAFMSVPDTQEHKQAALKTLAEFTNYAGDLGLGKTWIDYSALLPGIIIDELGIEILNVIERDPKDYGTQRAYGIGFPNGMDFGNFYFPKGRGQGHAASIVLLKMRRILEEKGVNFCFNTAIKEIIRDNEGTGKVIGAIAYDKEGNKIEVSCKALLVCSGGFSDNAEMLKEELGLTLTDYCRSGDGNVVFIHFPNAQLTGDGQQAVWNAGGKKGGMAVTGHCVVPNPGIYENIGWLPRNQARIIQEQPYLWVNCFGERFMNEEMTNQHMAVAAYLDNTPDKSGYIIFDEDTAKKMAEEGVEDDYIYFIFRGLKIENIAGQFDAMIEQGSNHVAHGDTLAEVCEQLGICESGLKKTLVSYNRYSETGVDEEFGKDAKFIRPVREESGHIYAMRISLGGYMTMGGIQVNRRCEVVDKKLYPIPGLYSAGDIISGAIFGNPPVNATGTWSQAMSTGMAAADYAAEYVKEGK